ncbi:MAG: hypothetical protein GXO43_01575 [Crenarchaeota archaeon]|nr:hypothetical protein [Thermoproteota archaeon]
MNNKGCNVSISEIKDAIDLLQNVDTTDKDMVYYILHTTLAKNDVCETALNETLKELKSLQAPATVKETVVETIRKEEVAPQQHEQKSAPERIDFGEWW